MKKNWLTLNMYINAWLDCSNPFISIHNKYNDDVLAHFNAEKVNQLFKDGEISVEDLQSTEPGIQINVITNLIAFQSRETIKRQISDMSLLLKKRRAEPQKIIATKREKQRIPIEQLFPSPIMKVV